MRICVLGQNGFIGHTVLELLRQKHDVVSEPQPCEVLVNCAGFSHMYEAKRNPDKMKAVEDVVFDRIKAVPCERIIHLSTIYVKTNPQEPYSQVKRMVEERLLAAYPQALILRLGSMLGPGLRKNAVYDLIHDDPLWVTPDSLYTYISTEDVARIVVCLIDHPRSGFLDVGGSEPIRISDVAELMGKQPMYGSIWHCIPMDVTDLQSIYPVKTSREYVKEFWGMCGNER